MGLFLGWSLWAAADAWVGARQVSAFRSSVTDDDHRDERWLWLGGHPRTNGTNIDQFQM